MIEKNIFWDWTVDKNRQKTKLVNITFSLMARKKLSKNELNHLRDTARDFFYFVQSSRA